MYNHRFMLIFNRPIFTDEQRILILSFDQNGDNPTYLENNKKINWTGMYT